MFIHIFAIVSVKLVNNNFTLSARHKEIVLIGDFFVYIDILIDIVLWEKILISDDDLYYFSEMPRSIRKIIPNLSCFRNFHHLPPY